MTTHTSTPKVTIVNTGFATAYTRQGEEKKDNKLNAGEVKVVSNRNGLFLMGHHDEIVDVKEIHEGLVSFLDRVHQWVYSEGWRIVSHPDTSTLPLSNPGWDAFAFACHTPGEEASPMVVYADRRTGVYVRVSRKESESKWTATTHRDLSFRVRFSTEEAIERVPAMLKEWGIRKYL